MKMTTGNNKGARSRTVASAATVAHSLHKSLVLEDILRECRTLLSQRFPLGRFTFVQHRVSDTTAALYTLDEEEGPLIGPRVIPIECSRISRCVTEHRRIFVRFHSASEQDSIEREHLLQSDSSAAVYCPLLWNGKLKGVLVLDLRGLEKLTSTQRLFLAYVARHMPLAIRNSDDHYMERRRTRQLALISNIAKHAVMIEDLDEFLHSSAELIRDGFAYNVVQIWTLSQRQELTLRAHVSAQSAEPIPEKLILPLIQECCTFNQAYCSNNIAADGNHPAHPGTASHLVVLIRLRGKILGVLSVESKLLEAFSETDVNITEGIASIVASTFDNLQMQTHAHQSNQYMQAILECAKDRAILSTDIYGYVLTSSAGVETVFHVAPHEVLGRDVLSLFTDPSFQGELALYINQSDRPTLERTRLCQTNGSTSSFLDVNLQRVYDAEKRPIGLLCMVRDVTERVQLQHSLEALSVTDELTGLYNQRRFFSAVADEVERCRRFSRMFTLCFFDLDGFKQFNDTQGHIRGDQALKETAKLIRTLVRAGVDTCYRYGGDEFTIIMPETSGERACLVVDRIRNRLSQHFSGGISASIGVAEYSDSASVEELVDKADRAMYTAKAAGGDRVVIAD